jgi:hypothetical protein
MKTKRKQKTKTESKTIQSFVVPFGGVAIIRATSAKNAAERVRKSLEAIDWDKSLGYPVDCLESFPADTYSE